MSQPDSPVRVVSEVGRLRRALVHEPGPEVDRMVPAMMEELLFDDILYGDRARNEHARFRRVLQLYGVEVHDSLDLLVETLKVPAARKWILDVLLDDLPKSIRGRLAEQTDQRLAQLLVAGLRREDGLSAGIEVDDLYLIPPLPNYCFQRDTQVFLKDSIAFTSMAAPARHREALLSRMIFSHHPSFSKVPVIFDPHGNAADSNLTGQQRPFVEGGDVLILSDQLIAVGLSERTNRTGIRRFARALSRVEGGPRWMVVVDVPRRRAYMHLDTLLTAIDRDSCLAFPPVILPGGAEEASVFVVDLHSGDLTFSSSDGVLKTLAGKGVDMEPIPCGGDDLVTQQREQWTDGANSLAIAPGVITLFDRNLKTAEELDKRGFQVVDAEDLLLGRAEVDLVAANKVCIQLRSNEISRARGGPHCLCHPIFRDD